jgi:transposase
VSVDECNALLGGWDGYRVGTVGRFEASAEQARPEVWIELHPCATRLRCSGCQEESSATHDVTARWVRDLPLLDAETRLLVHRRRVQCPRCGPKLEHVEWLDRYSRVTRRLGESVARLCQVLPIKHVAEFFGLGWDAVKAIDKAYLAHKLGPVDLRGVEVIAMDEFSLRKGHKYATVVVDPRSKRVLWVGRGRTREDIRPFFEQLGEQGCRAIKAVGMDMSLAFEEEVRLHCPQAVVVYDLFHVVAKYGRDVIDRVRVDEANRVRRDKKARQVVKGARWLLLRNAENLQGRDERIRLRELLAANRALLVVYLLKDDLKHLWTYRYAGPALRFWKGWYDRAMRSRIEPLKRFARRLKTRVHGILAHCQWPLNTSLLEGINNRIKVMKRMAYGFRDYDYFFLKIRAAFPGIAG